MSNRLTFLLAALCCISGCASDRGKPKTAEKPPSPAGPELVGRIASIPADKRFVLIQSYGSWKAESGQILTKRGPAERVANLKVTGEKLNDFAAADLQSGTVEIGDAVYSRPAEKPATLTPVAEMTHTEAQSQAAPIPKNN